MEISKIEYVRFMKTLKYSGLTAQQKRTLRGQFFAGDYNGAMAGLERLTKKRKQEEMV